MRHDTAVARGPQRPAVVADVVSRAERRSGASDTRRTGTSDTRRTGGGAAAAGLIALVPLAVLVAACASPGAGSGSSQSPGAAASHGAASPAGSGTPGASGVPAAAECATSALRAALGSANGAAGSSYLPIRFTNVSSSECTVYGYPGVSFVTSPGGSQVGNAANRIPLPNGQARTVPLPPGAVANALLQVVDNGVYPKSRCQPANGPYLRIYPPGQTAALYIRTRFNPGAACSSKAVTILQVEPVQPGPNPATG